MADNMRSIFREEIKRRVPTKKSIAGIPAFIKMINTLLKKSRLPAICVAGGSYAKGTILKDDFDVDLFVRFETAFSGKDISKLLGKSIAPLKPELVHGSRDYYQVRRNGVLFEIIPVLKIDDYRMAENVTDMSPLHVGYAKKHFARKKGLANDVRLAKQFCKGIGAYGAESYIRGFSGHVLDLLMIYYGSFERLLMQASLWGERVIIDIERHWKDPMNALNTSKTISPLVIVDPIQPDRNAAAAVSAEKFHLFRKRAREFLLSPSVDFFRIKKLDIKELKRRANGRILIVVRAKPLKGKDDVVGTKLLKVHEFIQLKLRKNDFSIIEAGWEYGDESILYYIVGGHELSATVMRKGPPVKDSINSEMFRKKHVKVSMVDGVLYAEEKRLHRSPAALVAQLIKDSYVEEKVKKIRIA
jgi:tRNA nucleotidyltransferase (CCA-adding enzyme)